MSTTSHPEAPSLARAWLHGEVSTFLRRTQGRETFASGPVASAPGGCIVKRTLEREPRSFLAWARARSRRRSAGQREFDNLNALAACGIAVPRAIDWCVERTAEGCRSVVVMERVAHRVTLREHFVSVTARERRDLVRELAGLVARMHAHGFVHRDLYLQHVLVRSRDGALVLIDAGRVRHWNRPRARWFVKDLAALLHSTPACVSVPDRLRFLALWLDARGIVNRSARRRFLRTVLAKRARMAAHVPRDERVRGDAR